MQVSGKPIKFVGEGEGMSALEPFYPDRMASRILGMGDVLTFVEKAQEVVREGCQIGLSFHVCYSDLKNAVLLLTFSELFINSACTFRPLV